MSYLDEIDEGGFNSNAHRATHDRPYFGRLQVLNIAEVQVGKVYQRVYASGSVIIEILEPPFKKKNGWWVKVRNLTYPREDTISLEDAGVTPYQGDNGPVWNPRNHLLRVE